MNTQDRIIYQHVDVLLYPVHRVKGKRIEGRILAKGEATGHAHVAEGRAELYQDDGMLYLRVTGVAEITHPEHKPLSISPGAYAVRLVSEYDHFAEEARAVRD